MQCALVLFVAYLLLQPLQLPLQLPFAQAQLSGQPMHFLPLFLDFHMNHPENPRIKRITATII
jgi:hypothetical protein